MIKKIFKYLSEEGDKKSINLQKINNLEIIYFVTLKYSISDFRIKFEINFYNVFIGFDSCSIMISSIR